MAVTTVTFTTETRDVPAHRVYLRETWDSDWVERTHLHCDFVHFTCNPDMAKAQFTWLYGNLLRAGESEWDVVEKLDHLRSFVKVEIDNPDDEDHPIIWTGILEEDNGEQKGVLATPEDGHGRGKQILVAYGLDIMLARHELRESISISTLGTEQTVQRPIEFNAKAQVESDDKTESPNRSPDPGIKGAFIFANDLTTAKYWTTVQAVEYLLAYHAPKDEVDDTIVKWQLDAAAFFGILPDFDKPRKPCEGRTLRQLLDEFIDRRRLLGYTVALLPVDGGIDKIEVQTFTFAPSDLAFDGNTIPANLSQKALIFDADTAVETAYLRQSTMEAIDQVVCTGQRAVACFTIDVDSDTLDRGWTSDQQESYEAGASGLAGYAALDDWDKEQRNKMARANEHVKRVYSYFGLPFFPQPDWTGKNSTGQPVFEDPDNPGVALPFYFPQLRFAHHLPLKTDHDYRGGNIADEEVPDNTPPGQKWEYRPSFVVIPLLNSSPKQYHVLNSLAINTEVPQPALETEDGYKWSASIRMQEDYPGFVLTVGGQPQHVLGGSAFTPLAVDDPGVAKFDWADLVATVAMPIDKFAEGRWPADPAPSQAVRRLVINLGDEYKLHYVAPNTMVAIDPDTRAKITSSGGFVRNDEPKLQALARLVYEWYRTPRQSIELSFTYVTAKLAIGDLITTIGQGDSLQTINSVVTGVKYEFSFREGSAPGIAKTTISTQFAELDARRFVGE